MPREPSVQLHAALLAGVHRPAVSPHAHAPNAPFTHVCAPRMPDAHTHAAVVALVHAGGSTCATPHARHAPTSAAPTHPRIDMRKR